ncbi:DUF2231 domain-containing protein [Gordonia sp. (in: high G+C Gram-positive bacteria)]|uniref:DUF2231 domain-containing protein n=1 Tax=Gordonia sp. (in: high G+C Gram-positive bacteria) TaxID=84139 RepID=UPI00261622C7|nr:DUF2231 domain-containing protein [Gordonia sp. (in: high G+C Gram-positive bacteria)]
MESFAGLPLHPLVVHFVVVAVPVTALVGIVVTLWPRARTALGVFPPVLALLTLISVPIATTAGEALYRKLGEPAGVAHHASIGDSLILAVGPMFGAIAMQWLLYRPAVTALIDRPDGTAGDTRLRWLRRFAALAVIAAAVASLTMVILAGDSGARAVWG